MILHVKDEAGFLTEGLWAQVTHELPCHFVQFDVIIERDGVIETTAAELAREGVVIEMLPVGVTAELDPRMKRLAAIRTDVHSTDIVSSPRIKMFV